MPILSRRHNLESLPPYLSNEALAAESHQKHGRSLACVADRELRDYECGQNCTPHSALVPLVQTDTKSMAAYTRYFSKHSRPTGFLFMLELATRGPSRYDPSPPSAPRDYYCATLPFIIHGIDRHSEQILTDFSESTYSNNANLGCYAWLLKCYARRLRALCLPRSRLLSYTSKVNIG